MNPLTIGTRSSPLAMWQAKHVAELLAKLGIESRFEKIRTSGDKHRTGPLASRGGKGLFVKELETALLDEEVDLAVHSLKDVPTVLSEEFALVAFLERADPRDCLISREGISKLEDLPEGARVGSCSPRRISQLLHTAPHVKVEDLRGNVETRLQKIREGVLDATFLAKAGLDRLAIDEPSMIHPLEPGVMLPAAGQGIVAIETLSGRSDLCEILGQLNHAPSQHAAKAERSLVWNLGGTCVSPIGGFAKISGVSLTLTGCVGDPRGENLLVEKIEGAASEAEDLGAGLAQRLNELGAQELLPSAPTQG